MELCWGACGSLLCGQTPWRLPGSLGNGPWGGWGVQTALEPGKQEGDPRSPSLCHSQSGTGLASRALAPQGWRLAGFLAQRETPLGWGREISGPVGESQALTVSSAELFLLHPPLEAHVL